MQESHHASNNIHDNIDEFNNCPNEIATIPAHLQLISCRKLTLGWVVNKRTAKYDFKRVRPQRQSK